MQPNPGLSWGQATQQIDAGHPFLFVWGFTSGGLHQLIAIGYSNDSAQQKLMIWDPLPVPKTSEPIAMAPLCGPLTTLTAAQIGSLHMKLIDFSTYTDPTNDMGVAAVHDDDQYALALKVPQAPVLQRVTHNMSANSIIGPPCQHDHGNVIHQGGVQFAARACKTHHPGPSGTQEENSAVREPRELGIPFPIVGLGVDQLRRPGLNPTTLLTQTISHRAYSGRGIKWNGR